MYLWEMDGSKRSLQLKEHLLPPYQLPLPAEEQNCLHVSGLCLPRQGGEKKLLRCKCYSPYHHASSQCHPGNRKYSVQIKENFKNEGKLNLPLESFISLCCGRNFSMLVEYKHLVVVSVLLAFQKEETELPKQVPMEIAVPIHLTLPCLLFCDQSQIRQSSDCPEE